MGIMQIPPRHWNLYQTIDHKVQLYKFLREALFTSATSDQNAENLSVSAAAAADYNHFLPVASDGVDSAVVYR